MTKKITPSRWRLPIPAEFLRGEIPPGGRWESTQTTLTSLGFERVMDTHALKQANVAFKNDEGVPQHYELWLHTAGVVATLQGALQTKEHPLSSSMWGTLYSQIDMGAGKRSFDDLSPLITKSIHTTSLDGRYVRGNGASFSGSSNIVHILENVQAHGYLLPFSEWSRAIEMALPPEIAGKRVPYIAPDIISRVREVLLKSTPSSLHPFLDEEAEDIPKQYVSGAVNDYLSNTLQAGGQRYVSKNIKELLTSWTRACLPEDCFWQKVKGTDAPLPPRLESMRILLHLDDAAFSTVMKAAFASPLGPAGISLPAVLLHCAQESDYPAYKRLLRVLREAPIEVLKVWASNPDARGYTFPMLACHHLFVSTELSLTHPFHSDSGVVRSQEVCSILVERLGGQSLRLVSDKRSVVGVVMERLGRVDSFWLANQAVPALFELVESMAQAGADAYSALRWGSRKESGKYSNEDEGAVSAAALDSMAKQWPDIQALKVAAARFQSKELGQVLQPAAFSAQRSRF